MSLSDAITDPVCGMTFVAAQAAASREHGGSTYHFCSVACALRFDLDAEAYIAASRLDLPEWGYTPVQPPPVDRGRPAPDQLPG